MAAILSGCAHLPALPPLPTKANLAKKEKQRMDIARLSSNHDNLEQARHIYNTVLEKNPKNREAWHRLAVIASQESKWDEAEDHYRRVAELGPMTPQLLCDMGYTLYLQHRLPEAENLLRNALAKDPRNKAAANNMALVLGQQGRFDECLAYFRQANTEAEAEANFAYVLTQMGQPKLAQAHFSRALSLDPEQRSSAQALLQLARLEGGGQPVAPVVDQRLIAPNNAALQQAVAANLGAQPQAAIFGPYNGAPVSSSQQVTAQQAAGQQVAAQPAPPAQFAGQQITGQQYAPQQPVQQVAGYAPNTLPMPQGMPASSQPMPVQQVGYAGPAQQSAMPIPTTAPANSTNMQAVYNAPAANYGPQNGGAQPANYYGQMPGSAMPGNGSTQSNMQPMNTVQPFNVVPAGGGAAVPTSGGTPYGLQRYGNSQPFAPGMNNTATYPAPFVR